MRYVEPGIQTQTGGSGSKQDYCWFCSWPQGAVNQLAKVGSGCLSDLGWSGTTQGSAFPVLQFFSQDGCENGTREGKVLPELPIQY